MLSARGEEHDVSFVPELGVDDYVVKPFVPKEPGGSCKRCWLLDTEGADH